MSEVGFIRITEFSPDSPEWDVPLMDECENLIPYKGGYREVKKPGSGGYTLPTLGENVANGVHAHLLTEDDADEILYSDTEINYNGNVGFFTAYSDDVNISRVTPDEENYISFRTTGNDNPVIYFNLTDPLYTPDGTGEHIIYFRYRTTSGYTNWTVDVDLNEEGIGDVAGLAIDDTSPNSSNSWTTSEDDHTNPTITSHDDLRLKIDLSSSETDFGESATESVEMPARDVENVGNWTLSTGSDTYALIDDAWAGGWGAGAETTYVESPPMSSGTEDQDSYVVVGFTDFNPTVNTDDPEQTDSIAVYAKHTGSSGDFKLHGQLVDLRDDSIIPDNSTSNESVSVTIGSSATEAAGTYEIVNTGITSVNEIAENWENYGLKLWAENVDATTASTSTNYPTGVSGVDAPWTDNGGGALTAADVGAGGSAYAKASTKLKNVDFVANFGSITQPDDLSNVYVRIRARVDTTTGGPRLRIRNNDNGSTLLYFDVNNTSNWKTYSKRLSVAQATALSWGGTLDLEVATAKNTGDNAVEYNVDWIRVEVPGNTPTLRIYAAGLKRTVQEGIDIAWGACKVPYDATGPFIGDLNRVFVGSEDKMSFYDDLYNRIYFSDDFGLEAVSPSEPYAWEFASFGNNVFMTNGVDEVKEWDPTTPTTIARAFTGGDAVSSTPEALLPKYIATVGDHLVIANIDATNYTSYTVSFSHFNNPNSFSEGDVGNQSDFQNLTSTPGEITGLLGGEYGLIFKRNSIYRMSYVGPDVIFRFDLISDSIGTPYNKSIVKVGSDVYFYNSGGFWVMRGGGYPQNISDGKISRYLVDEQFEDNSITTRKPGPVFTTSNIISGTYDVRSGMIYWIYRTSGDIDNVNRTFRELFNQHIIVYNPAENRWSYIDLDDFTDIDTALFEGVMHVDKGPVYTNIVSRLNPSDSPSVTSSLDLIYYCEINDGNYPGVTPFDFGPFASSKIKTKRLSARSLSKEADKRITIKAIRPLFSRVPDNYLSIPYTFIIESFDSPTASSVIRTQTVDGQLVLGDDGWYEIDPHVGEYFTIETQLSSHSDLYTIKDFIGYEIRFDVGGDF
jgi:hypothetical protein